MTSQQSLFETKNLPPPLGIMSSSMAYEACVTSRIEQKNSFTTPGGETEKKTLRPLQSQAIESLREAIRHGKRRIVLKAPTGFGKSLLAANILSTALSRHHRVIFCVNAIALIDQTIQKFYEEGIRDIGVIQANHIMTDPEAMVQVCSVQTLQRRHIPKAGLVIIDEVHNLFKFYTHWAQLPEWRDVPFIGLSATPYTAGLGRIFDTLIVPCTTQQLIDQKWLSPFRVFSQSHPDLSGVTVVAGDYHEGELSAAMDKKPLVADVVDTWIKHGENRPTLCYGVNRAHAKHLQEEFLKAGIGCGYQDAYTEMCDRRDIAGKFKTGEIKVVCNISTLTTGIDWDVRCISLVRPTKSDMLFQQIIGRGLRIAEGKKDCLILDHSDTHLRLGMVTDIDEKYTQLDDGKKKESSNKKKKDPPLPKECSNCHFLKPAGASCCPSCGFKAQRQNDVEHVEGELVEVGNDMKAKKKENKATSSTDKRQFFGELIGYAKQKAYKPGWAAQKYKSRYGVWPNAHRDADPIYPTRETLNWIRHEQIKWSKRKVN